MLNNVDVYNDIICGRCCGREHKAIPEQWDDDNHVFYHIGWYFCLNCGVHVFIPEQKVA